MNDTIKFPGFNIELHIGKSISVFGFEIAYYGIIIAIGMIIGVTLVLREARRCKVNEDNIMDCAVYVLLMGILGARIYYVIFEWEYYKNNLADIIKIRNGGLAIYGGIIAGVITLFIFCKIKKINPLQILDMAVLGLVVGQMCGRWGNFFNREAFGRYYTGKFAMQIPLEEANGLTDELISHAVNGFISVHPTFLYESIWNMCLLFILYAFRKHKKNHGEVFALYLCGYGIGRALIEGLRTDQLTIGNTGIAISQLLSIIFAICGLVYIIYSHFFYGRNNK